MLKRLTLVKFCSYFGNIETKKVIRKRKLFDQWKLVFSREIFWPCFLICFKWSWCFIDFFLGRNLVYLETSDNNDNYNKRLISFITLEIINLNTFYFNSFQKFVFSGKRRLQEPFDGIGIDRRQAVGSNPRTDPTRPFASGRDAQKKFRIFRIGKKRDRTDPSRARFHRWYGEEKTGKCWIQKFRFFSTFKRT